MERYKLLIYGFPIQFLCNAMSDGGTLTTQIKECGYTFRSIPNMGVQRRCLSQTFFSAEIQVTMLAAGDGGAVFLLGHSYV